MTENEVRTAAVGHPLALQRALSRVALSTGVVGVVALDSALDSAVAKRQRELTALHALGAPNRLLALTVMGEALLVVVFSSGAGFAARPAARLAPGRHHWSTAEPACRRLSTAAVVPAGAGGRHAGQRGGFGCGNPAL